MNIYILYTGGTIGSVGDPLAPMDGPSFNTAFTELVTPMIVNEIPGTTVTMEWFDNTLDSTNMQPSEWVLMAQKILDNYEAYDDFLVLHGTDTMAWTASALSYMLPGLSKSVTVTGSQLPMFVQDPSDESYQFLFNTDALRNVLGAIRFFTMEVPEVCLYFADNLFRGNRTVKSNATNFVAFSSPNYHALGNHGVNPTLFSHYVLPVPKSKSLSLSTNLTAAKTRLTTIDDNIQDNSVLQIQTFPGFYNSDGSVSMFASMLEQLRTVSPTVCGIIFESYGIGNIPSFQSVQDKIGEMHDTDGMVLVDCTQVFAGGVNYNEYATGAWLKEKGVISGQDTTAIGSMAKLTVLKAANPTASQDELEYMMGESLAGELTSYYSLSGYQNDYLAPGESLFSISGAYEFANEESGYIVLYDVSGDGDPISLWSQGTGKPGRVVMQADNNLVYYDAGGNVTYSSKDDDVPPAEGINSYLKVGDDGSLKLYNLDTDVAWLTIFAGPGVKPAKKKLLRRRGKKGRKQKVRHS